MGIILLASSTFDFIFCVVTLFYAFQQIIFLVGYRKRLKQVKDFEPQVSVIVSARNEEQNIFACLDSLSKLNYPKEKLEVLVVDDFSEDKTGEIIDSFTQKFPYIKKIVPSKKIIDYPGKTNAVANAIELSKGDIIFTTDADCIVKPSWIKTLLKYYTDDVGVVCGFTLQEANSQFTGMQNLDWVYLLTVAAGTINLNVPLSCIGNNMSYRKCAYEQIGGYKGFKFSVTEDFALLHKIHSQTKYRIVYPNDAEALVITKPCPDLKSLYRQKHRWGVGGTESKFIGYFVMSWGFIAHLMMILQIFFGSVISFSIMLFKILCDLIFISIPMSKFKILNQLKYFLAFEVYFILYVLLLPIAVLIDKKVIWKERSY